jgi:low affinity Fe/Cu permease
MFRQHAHSAHSEPQTRQGLPGFGSRKGDPTKSKLNSNSDWFHWFASQTAHLSGRPIAFALAVMLIVVWGVTGPLFGFSDTWQLVINTGTTIVTFLMVFLIQHTQNRDALALQVKLAELIIAAHGTQNRVAAAEEMSEDELQALHEAYCERASETLASLNMRRTGGGVR